MSKENILRASLNRFFDECGKRNPSGSVCVPARFLRVCERLGAISISEKLKKWEADGFLKIIKDPSSAPDDEEVIELFKIISE